MPEFNEDDRAPTLACPTCNSPTALGPWCGKVVKQYCINCGCRYLIKVEVEMVKPGKIIFDPIDHAEAVRKRAGTK